MVDVSSECDEELMAVIKDIDRYENPASNLSMTSSTSHTDNKGDGKTPQKAVSFKVELKKNEVVVKEGRAGWERFDPLTQDTIAKMLHWLYENGPSVAESNKVEQMFTEVEDFCANTKAPPVKTLRAGIPKAVFLLYHFQEATEGREKVKNLWHESKKPKTWPKNVRFEDPNNAPDGSPGKMVRRDLVDMYDVIKKDFKMRQAEIKKQVEEHMAASPRVQQEKYPPWYQRLRAEQQRTEGTMAELAHHVRGSASPQLVTDIRQGKNWLEKKLSQDMTDEERVKYLKTCMDITMMAEAVLITDQPSPDRLAEFQRCLTDMQGQMHQSVQPESMDAGQFFLYQDIPRLAPEQTEETVSVDGQYCVQSMEINRQVSVIGPVTDSGDVRDMSNLGDTMYKPPSKVVIKEQPTDVLEEQPSSNLNTSDLLDLLIDHGFNYSDVVLKDTAFSPLSPSEPSTMLMDTEQSDYRLDDIQEFIAEHGGNQVTSAVITDNTNFLNSSNKETGDQFNGPASQQQMEGVQNSQVWMHATSPNVLISDNSDCIPLTVEMMLT